MPFVAPAFPSPIEVPTWGLGPFVREDDANPLFSAQQHLRFDCPMRGAPVAWEKAHVFNPAAVVHDGQVCVIYRAEDGSGAGLSGHTSRLSLAHSPDGLHFTGHPEPVVRPENDGQKVYECPGGCEDPRVVAAEDGTYVLTYTQWDRRVARLAVATSRDLIHWRKHGPAFAAAHGGRFRDTWSKAGAIVARRDGDRLVAALLDGRYWMYWGEGTIYAASSDDLIQWTPVLDGAGKPLSLLAPRPGLFDSMLCEPGPPAVLTDAGIVLLYNGKNDDSGQGRPSSEVGGGAYSAGQALLSADDPTQLLARTDRHFLTPERSYERTGQYSGGTVFIQGLVPFGGRWLLYYGAADSVIAVASAPAGFTPET